MFYLYANGYDPAQVYPYLLAFLGLVLSTEFLRFTLDSFNVLYCRVVGPLMRQSEIHSRVNGVAYYLAGTVPISLFFFMAWPELNRFPLTTRMHCGSLLFSKGYRIAFHHLPIMGRPDSKYLRPLVGSVHAPVRQKVLGRVLRCRGYWCACDLRLLFCVLSGYVLRGSWSAFLCFCALWWSRCRIFRSFGRFCLSGW